MTEGAPDRKGLSIFDNAPTGGFHVRSRGYDREQVERYVRKLEDKLREATARGAERGEQLARAEERVAELSGEVNALRSRVDQAEHRLRNVDQPSFSGLGEHVSSLLSSAEEQAQQLVATATAEAESLRSAATAEADALRSDARTQADQIRREAEESRRTADDASRTLRADAEKAATLLRSEAEAEATRLRQEANEDATAARVAAVEESKALLASAKTAAADIRSAADADADAQREAAATLLHQTRQRADHQMGAVTAALSRLQERLAAAGSPVTEPPEEAETDPVAGDEQVEGQQPEDQGPDDDADETQLFPVVGS